MQLSRLIKQKEYETIEFALRRHPITFLSVFFLSLFMLVIPIGVYLMISSLFPQLIASQVLYTVFIFSISAYFVSVYLFLFSQFIDFYLDIWIVTNDRIIDIEQFGLFSRTVSELELFSIQDVTTSIHGILPTLFDYGDITVKTASQNISIVFKQVKNPNVIRQRIIQLAANDRQYHTNNQETPLPPTS